MKKGTVGALVLAMAFVLSACGTTLGTVIAKEYHSVLVSVRQQCVGHDRNGLCNAWTSVTEHPAGRWTVTVRDDQGEQRVLVVSESEYEAIEIGDRYSY